MGGGECGGEVGVSCRSSFGRRKRREGCGECFSGERGEMRTDWECGTCTLMNHGRNLKCEVCNANAPDVWSCVACTYANEEGLQR